MKKEYDIVYLTNTPSFYKLNLCNEVGKHCSLLLVLYGYGAEAVNTQLEDKTTWNFDFEFISNGDSNQRNKVRTFIKLISLMSRIHAKKIIFAGWIAPEYNLYSFLSPKHKNVMVCESSILDVKFDGLSGRIKKAIINRMSATLPSGQPHKQLFDSIGFNGKQYITGSVGIFNKTNLRTKANHSPLKYLYVGRLIDAKEVELLVDVFNKNGMPLTIAGDGILRDRLKSKAKSNITFIGFISNEKIGEVYSEHDIFILPSKYEPWGLVVEEALFRGLPVVVSDKVGSSIDMVKNLNSGEIFESGNADSLQAALDNVAGNYHSYRKAVEAIDWAERDRNQVNAYLKLLD